MAIPSYRLPDDVERGEFGWRSYSHWGMHRGPNFSSPVRDEVGRTMYQVGALMARQLQAGR